MNKAFKNIKFTKRGVYISLAICMLLIGCIGIFSAITNMGKIINDSDLLDAETIGEAIDNNFLDTIKGNEVVEEVIKNEAPVVLDFVMPVDGEILKGYSGADLVYSYTMNDYRTHTGVDIVTPDGSTVVSAESGKIANIENHPLWGTCIEVEHANGYATCYRNLSNIIPEGIEIGSYIEAGGVIGTVGSTALVEIGENSHLHFEMSVNGTNVDPLEYIK